MRFTLRSLLHSALIAFLALTAASAATPAARFELRDGDRVVFLGDTLIEREQYHGWIELMLSARSTDRRVTFRNLGWSADTPAGVSRTGLSPMQAAREPANEGWIQLQQQITDAKPTVIFVGYGMANSFDGSAGEEQFRADYLRLVDALAKLAPAARLVLLSPSRHENHGDPAPDPTAHNATLSRLSATIRDVAAARILPFFSLFDALAIPMATAAASPAAARLTDNGIHLNAVGYRAAAVALEDFLFVPGVTTVRAPTASTWRTSPAAEPLRQAILRKNQWFFHRSRPANMAYIFGFRKKEQGQNAVEVVKFDGLIAAEEARIARLSTLDPAAAVAVPAVPLRVGNLIAQPTPQPVPTFTVDDALEVTLWAENPLLNKPVHMNFDPQGRLWVASSEVYPQIEPGQAATDKIIVLQDTTGAGRADKATVFADGLLIPTGVAPGDGGVYVTQSTELLHLRDTDGDGKADERRIVLSGFGTEDTHHNVHGLRWGPDGRLYFIQSVYTRSHTETPNGVVRLAAGGLFRFDPRDQQLSILFRGWINAWGHQFDPYGQSFVTDGAGSRGISWAVPGATHHTNTPSRRMLESISPGSYPKFSGLEIIRSTHFPADWQGDFITADFRAHRIVRFKANDQGSAYITRELPDLLRSTDASFRPLDAKLGPDGALYVSDWANPIIQHGEVDFRDVRRDKVHGRIWRITAKGRALLAVRDFTKIDNTALLNAILSANSYDADQAKRVLVERGATRVAADLAAWTARQTEPLARFHALWAHEALNLRSSALLAEQLAAADPNLRAAAIRALPVAGSLTPLTKLIADENPRVRLAAVRALGRLGTARAAELALSVLDQPMDSFLDYALWLTVNELAAPWLAAVRDGSWSIAGREAQLAFGLKAVEPALAGDVLAHVLSARPIPRDGSGPWFELVASAGSPREQRLLFDALLADNFDAKAAPRVLAALNDAARLRKVIPRGDLAPLGTLITSTTTRSAALTLVGGWKLESLVPALVRLARAPTTSLADRAVAFNSLREIGGAPVMGELRLIAREAVSPALRREAVVALAGVDFANSLPEIIVVLNATTVEAEATTLWRELLSIRDASSRLAIEVPNAKLSIVVARAGLRPAREGGQNQSLVQALMKAAGLTFSDVQLTAPELQSLARQALAAGDAARGERIYRRPELACIACHAIGGAGSQIGPDLTSVGASAPTDYLVESILYPSAKIKEDYHAVALTTKDGRELSGMIARETATEIVLRDATNQEISVAIQNVAKRQNSGSLMPAGLIDGLLPEERLDLIKFLSQLGRPGNYDAANGGVARLWQLYMIDAVNEPIGVEPVIRGDRKLADWRPTLALVNGSLPRDLIAAPFPPTFHNSRGLFAATRFESAKGGRTTFTLTGTAKDAWLNGKLLQPGATFTVTAQPGANVLVLQLIEKNLPGELILRSPDVTFLTN